MDSLSKIRKFSKMFYLLLSLILIVTPIYYIVYWVFINQLPETLINVNTDSTPLAPHTLSVKLQLIGFMASLLPLSALAYGLMNTRKLFFFYNKGVIFSFEHVALFRKVSKALVMWVFFSIVYESAKSVIFSMGNPPGSRVITVGFTSSEMTTLVVGGIVFFIAWVMDEGRIMTEENELTV